MALERSARPLTRCIRCIRHNASLPKRSISSTASRKQETTTEPPSAAGSPPPAASEAEPIKEKRLDPNTVSTPRAERRLIAKQNQYPIGSRRRRAALSSAPNIPFHELPYQCFQEARKVLKDDRLEKVAEIDSLRRKIERLSAENVAPENEARREERITSWKKDIERLKILADINDPLVKKKFEDGLGDMNKPIYRHLSDLQWRSHKRQILMQRITQMNVVPDVLPAIDPIVSTSLSFGRTKIPHGDIVPAAVSERPPRLEIQSYGKGEKLVSIAVVTPDVPNVEKDGFDYRCHFLAANVPISPTQTHVDLGKLRWEDQIIQDWTPPYSQKGAPYQRLAVFILEQPSITDPANALEATAIPSRLDIPAVKSDARYANRGGFILRSFASKYRLQPIGVDLFRSQWDETTAGVMRRNGVPGWDVEFKRKRIDPLPYQRLKGERYR